MTGRDGLSTEGMGLDSTRPTHRAKNRAMNGAQTDLNGHRLAWLFAIKLWMSGGCDAGDALKIVDEFDVLKACSGEE